MCLSTFTHPEIHPCCVHPFLPFYFWVVFCCTDIYPFTCQWPFGWFPVFCYCEYGCYEHSHIRLCMDGNFLFSWENTLDMESLGKCLTFKEIAKGFSKVVVLLYIFNSIIWEFHLLHILPHLVLAVLKLLPIPVDMERVNCGVHLPGTYCYASFHVFIDCSYIWCGEVFKVLGG